MLGYFGLISSEYTGQTSTIANNYYTSTTVASSSETARKTFQEKIQKILKEWVCKWMA
jgi:hypothetical protein